MALYSTGNDDFDIAATAAEVTRQHQMRGVANQQVADFIHCQYFNSVIGAGQAFNITTINEETAALALDCGRFGGLFILDQSTLGGGDVLGP